MKLQYFLALLVSSQLVSCCNEDKIKTYSDDLYSSTSSVRNEAALQLARCGGKASSEVPRLAQMLYDNNVGVQSSAAYALRKIDTQGARDALESAEAAREARRK